MSDAWKQREDLNTNELIVAAVGRNTVGTESGGQDPDSHRRVGKTEKKGKNVFLT